MIAILLYLIGLVSVVLTIVVIGVDAPSIYATLATAWQSGLGDLPPALGGIAAGLGWALTPLLGGLLLMGFARIIMLLGNISRALRGPA
jgi:hypothetical protein